MAYVIVFVLLVAVVLVVVSPLRRGRGPDHVGDEVEATGSELLSPVQQDRVELEAARESKLREIRDAELDHQTGKLSDDDYEAIDSQLRAEAIAIITRIDELDGLGSAEPEGAGAVDEPGRAPAEPAAAPDEPAAATGRQAVAGDEPSGGAGDRPAE